MENYISSVVGKTIGAPRYSRLEIWTPNSSRSPYTMDLMVHTLYNRPAFVTPRRLHYPREERDGVSRLDPDGTSSRERHYLIDLARGVEVSWRRLRSGSCLACIPTPPLSCSAPPPPPIQLGDPSERDAARISRCASDGDDPRARFGTPRLLYAVMSEWTSAQTRRKGCGRVDGGTGEADRGVLQGVEQRGKFRDIRVRLEKRALMEIDDDDACYSHAE